MRPVLIAVGIILIAVVALVISLLNKAPAMLGSFLELPSPEELYPPAPAMPPIIAAGVEDLLAQHEAFLMSKAPKAFAALQPGLSDAEIDAIEKKCNLKLTDDLRVLYLWRNGTPGTANVDAFPNHQFVPLDVALANRGDLRKQVEAGTPEQQRAYATFVGHRDGWVGLIVDLAGDGHFFDPDRLESQGSFFYCFAEDGTYVFYPAFRNYLAAVVEGEKQGVFVAGPSGVDTADFVKAQQLWKRYGAVPNQ